MQRARTIATRTPGGNLWRLGDPDAARVEWQLELNELSDEEAGALRALFHECEGRRGTFCFLDPTANLLSYSEDLLAPAWEKDPMMQVAAGASDPLGEDRATQLTNNGQTQQALWQTLSVPAHYRYCLSVYIRSGAPTPVQMFQRSATGEYLASVQAETKWRRAICSGVAGGAEDTLRFGLELPAGSVADVFGWQVEAQPGASAYKRTPAAGGVYPNARFGDDALIMTAGGPGRTSTTVRIESAQADI